MARKNMKLMTATVTARLCEWANTTYVPAINVNIIATMDIMFSTVDATSNHLTRTGSSFIDEMK